MSTAEVPVGGSAAAKATARAKVPNTQTWSGEAYPADQLWVDATAMEAVTLLGEGSVSDMLCARPAVTVLGIDCPPVVGSAERALQVMAATMQDAYRTPMAFLGQGGAISHSATSSPRPT